MNVLVIGASRGIGVEFVRQYRADGARVVATARDDAGLGAALGLDATSRVLLIGTEGATDPDIWRSIVGRDPGTVQRRAAP